MEFRRITRSLLAGLRVLFNLRGKLPLNFIIVKIHIQIYLGNVVPIVVGLRYGGWEWDLWTPSRADLTPVAFDHAQLPLPYIAEFRSIPDQHDDLCFVLMGRTGVEPVTTRL